MMRRLAIALVACAAPALAQVAPPDTARALPTVVVTAEHRTTTLESSVSAVTRLSAGELARTPRATLADVLRRAPGFAVVDMDGLGFDPQLMVRGFYGGGEAEYVVVLIDGRPVNQLHSGLVAWDVLPPLASIEAVEIVRGSASPLYGDAAIGGVINVITRNRVVVPLTSAEASRGTFGGVRATVDTRVIRPFGLALGIGIDHTDGFRDHAARTSGRARAGVALVDGADARLEVAARSHWRTFDEPGPLLSSLMAEDRTASDAIFRFDRTTDQGHVLTVDGFRMLGASVRASGSLGGEIRATESVRTLALATGFGDTKLRDLSSIRAAGSLQLDIQDTPVPGTDWLIVGAELAHGTIESKYYPVAGGSRDDYAAASGRAGDLEARGDSRRSSGSLHAQYNLQPSDAVRFALGARLDVLRDALRPDLPADVERESVSHTAFSPRLGLNVRYSNHDRGVGNAYVAVSRSFKAPTLDQLYDLRGIPVPFPPFVIRTSNPELHPQHGTSVEAGLYHDLALSRSLRGNASVSVYQIAMRDELDFSVESFRYVNIGRSRHRGVEAAVSVVGARASTFANYTLQSVISRSGANEGKRLKAIPRHTVGGGVSVQPWRMLESSLLVTHVRGAPLDDANTVELPAFTRVDARVALGVRGASLFLDVRNVLNERYSSTGFLDPGGSGEAYFHPAAGRVIELGIRRTW